MKDFFEKIQKMLQKSVDELKNFDWNELQNVETIGIWPAPVKLLLIILVFGGFLGGGFWFHIKPLQASLASVISEEETLRSDLELKAILAANLEAYRQQLADMQ